MAKRGDAKLASYQATLDARAATPRRSPSGLAGVAQQQQAAKDAVAVATSAVLRGSVTASMKAVLVLRCRLMGLAKLARVAACG